MSSISTPDRRSTRTQLQTISAPYSHEKPSPIKRTAHLVLKAINNTKEVTSDESHLSTPKKKSLIEKDMCKMEVHTPSSILRKNEATPNSDNRCLRERKPVCYAISPMKVDEKFRNSSAKKVSEVDVKTPKSIRRSVRSRISPTPKKSARKKIHFDETSLKENGEKESSVITSAIDLGAIRSFVIDCDEEILYEKKANVLTPCCIPASPAANKLAREINDILSISSPKTEKAIKANTQKPAAKNAQTNKIIVEPNEDEIFENELFATKYDPEKYFQKTKNVVSANSISRLKTTGADGDKRHIVNRNKESALQANIKKCCEENFPLWFEYLKFGLSVLVYGAGSKYILLDAFRKKCQEDNNDVFLINGFFPDLTLKEVMESLVVDLIGEQSVPRKESDTLKILERNLKQPLYVVVHNIDGLALRRRKTQRFLSRFAALQNVHLVASIDHIRAPLLWSVSHLSKFNFIWENCATYQSHSVEAPFLNGGRDFLSTRDQLLPLELTYRSLGGNARSVLKYLLSNHLKKRSEKLFKGISFVDLYEWCRCEMLITSNVGLRKILKEFTDHNIVKVSSDDNICVTIKNHSQLKNFYDSHFAGEDEEED